MIDVPSLAWMAGVIDMKGRVRRLVHKSRANPAFMIVVETRKVGIVKKLGAMTGTRTEFTEPTRFEIKDRRGCVEHCPEPHVHVTNMLPGIGRWHVTGTTAAIVTHNLLPYFGDDDGDRAAFIKEIIDCVPKDGARGRRAVDQSIARMIRHGWTIPEELLT